VDDAKQQGPAMRFVDEELALNHAGLSDIELFMIESNETERNIIGALNGETLTLEQPAAKAGYEVSGHFRRTVTSLSKRGILGNKRPGYYVQPQYLQLISELSA
jgi:hypothetical protein